jgi:ribonuclease T2
VPFHPLLSLRAALAALVLAATPALAGTAGDFDFYVLSLSWSPAWCATAERPDRNECGTPRGFVVHGLWPQYDGGGGPDSCPTNMPQFVPAPLLDSVADIMPARGLAAYEWRRHGVCSGLPQSSYFPAIRRAWQAVKIPKLLQVPPEAGENRHLSPREIEAAFVAVNPRLLESEIAVRCDDGVLEEVRVCLTRQFQFRRCPAVDRASCRDARISLLP